MGALAALLGLVDFLSIPRVYSLTIAWIRFFSNAVAVLHAIWSVSLRGSDAAAAPGGFAVALSAIVTAILIVTGWLGGELTHRPGSE